MRIRRLLALLGTDVWICLAQDAPTFRSTTNLVEFTIVAQDSKGNPITDLTKDDLQVTERGKSRDLSFFRFEGRNDAPALKPLPPGVVSNRPEFSAGPPRNVSAILLDALNTPAKSQLIASADLHFRPAGDQLSSQVDIAIAEKTATGALDVWRDNLALNLPSANTLPPAVRYVRTWKLKPSTSVVRVLVRDRFTDRYGTVDLPVKNILR